MIGQIFAPVSRVNAGLRWVNPERLRRSRTGMSARPNRGGFPGCRAGAETRGSRQAGPGARPADIGATTLPRFSSAANRALELGQEAKTMSWFRLASILGEASK